MAQVWLGALGVGILGACSDLTPTGVQLPPAAESPSFYEGSTTSTSGGSLIYCPNYDTREAERVIGPEGGTVSVAGHGITLPPNALPWPTRIRVKALASQYLEVRIRADDLPEDRFLVPAEVTLSYARCNDLVADSGLTAWHIEPLTHQMLENMGGTVNPADSTITFPTGHLSIFALSSN